MSKRMTPAESDAWRPEIQGWSHDILPFYRALVPKLPAAPYCAFVGLYHGRDLIFMAEELTAAGKTGARLVGFDPGESDQNEIYENYIDVLWNAHEQLVANLARTAAARRVAVEIFPDLSPGAAARFADGELDFGFLDGDHREHTVRAECPAWARKIKPGGFLAGHDYGHEGFPGVKIAVDEFFGSRVRVTAGSSVWCVQL
jgi:hypothetical protein